jgi:hypothetical protein
VSGEIGGVGESKGMLCRDGDDEDELVDMVALVSDFFSCASPEAGAGAG